MVVLVMPVLSDCLALLAPWISRLRANHIAVDTVSSAVTQSENFKQTRTASTYRSVTVSSIDRLGCPLVQSDSL